MLLEAALLPRNLSSHLFIFNFNEENKKTILHCVCENYCDSIYYSSGTVINYGTGSKFLSSYSSSSRSATEKVTVLTVPVPQHWTKLIPLDVICEENRCKNLVTLYYHIRGPLKLDPDYYSRITALEDKQLLSL
jgi:hypothetical protein